MTRLRRRQGTLYRVYGEEEYLAGADALTAWEDALAPRLVQEPAHGRRLQRIAGAAALTGAVGTVGSVVGLAGLRTHAADPREIAQRVMSPVRTTAPRGHASTPVHPARRRTLQPTWSPGQHVRRGKPGALSHRSAPRVQTAARTIAVSASIATAARETAVRFTRAREASTETQSAAPGGPAETASAPAETSSAATEARPRAQSEFGFER